MLNTIGNSLNTGMMQPAFGGPQTAGATGGTDPTAMIMQMMEMMMATMSGQQQGGCQCGGAAMGGQGCQNCGGNMLQANQMMGF